MSNIEWTDCTWNPVVGCSPVSPGCLNCYAAVMARRLEGMGTPGYGPRRVDGDGRDVGGLPGLQDEDDRTLRIAEVRAGRAVFTGDVRCLEDRLVEPLHWRKPRRVFVCSMADLFHESVPFAFIDRVWAVMALCPQHTFQVLTKRPERMAEYLAGVDDARRHQMNDFANSISEPADNDFAYNAPWPLPNVWVGTSVEDQARADERIPHLLRCPAVVRFLSVEPLLEAVDLRLRQEVLTDLMDAEGRQPGMRGRYPLPSAPFEARTRRWHFLHWVIVGGESGPKARPCDVGHVRGVVQQCRAAGVPVFVKQLGAFPFAEASRATQADLAMFGHRLKDRKGGDPAEWPEDLRVREWPSTHKAQPARRAGPP